MATTFSARDQLLVELANRARLDPSAEAQRLGIDLNAGLAAGTISASSKQPVAPNDILRTSALGHSNWMLNTDTFSHTGAGGSSPGNRMTQAGYAFDPTNWRWGENIAWLGNTKRINADALTLSLHDNFIKSASHRVALMRDAYREVGIGTAVGQFGKFNSVMTTENFARSGDQLFLTGVAINDRDGDRFYDIGEGVGNVVVTATSIGSAAVTTSTAAAGGYTLEIGAGQTDLEFSGGRLQSSMLATIDVTEKNAKVDLVNTDTLLSSVTIDLGTGGRNVYLLGLDSINATGNDAANLIVGNKGHNVLRGEGGSDTLRGLEGNDFIFGDEGNDTLEGGLGSDTLTGGAGQDQFRFATTNDSTVLAAGRDVIVDFVSGEDQIDLRLIDANSRQRKDQAFTFSNTEAPTGRPGALWVSHVDVDGVDQDRTYVYGDVNGDRLPDFQIELRGIHNLTAFDFIL